MEARVRHRAGTVLGRELDAWDSGAPWLATPGKPRVGVRLADVAGRVIEVSLTWPAAFFTARRRVAEPTETTG